MEERTYGATMSKQAMMTFLDQQGDGVLSFDDEQSYSIPMSFGYDPVENRCIFQFVFDDESTKADLIEAGRSVTLVTYEWAEPDDWTSVIATGALEPIADGTPEEIAASEIFAPRATAIPLTAFEGSLDEMEPQWYELRIEDLSGRTAVQP